MDYAKEGGPAFPRDHRYEGHNGISLRDWFAGQALMGLVAFDRQDGPNGNQPKHFARWSFAVADAMLASRTEGEG